MTNRSDPMAGFAAEPLARLADGGIDRAGYEASAVAARGAQVRNWFARLTRTRPAPAPASSHGKVAEICGC